MIANRVQEYLSGNGQPLVDAELQAALAAIGKSMARNLGMRREAEEDGGRKVRRLRPSDPYACGRRLVFDSLALEPEPFQWRSRLTFTHGDMTEAMGVLVFRQALAERGESDLLVTPTLERQEDGTYRSKQVELSATINPADWGVEGDPFTLTGHLDMTLRGKDGGEDVADWKGISDWAFNNMQAAAANAAHEWWEKEAPGYVAQVRWYMIMLRVLGRGQGQYGYLVGVNKNTGHVTEVQVERDHEAERDLIRRAVYTLRWQAEAAERRAIVLQDYPEGFMGDKATDAVLEDWTRQHVPRPGWAEQLPTEKPGRNKRPDGTTGRAWSCTPRPTCRGGGVRTAPTRAGAGPNTAWCRWAAGRCTAPTDSGRESC